MDGMVWAQMPALEAVAKLIGSCLRIRRVGVCSEAAGRGIGHR